MAQGKQSREVSLIFVGNPDRNYLAELVSKAEYLIDKKIQYLIYSEEEFQERQDPSGKPYYWLTGKFVNHEPDREDTDEWALSQGYISLVPVQYDVTAYHVIDQIKGLENEK